MGDGDDQTDAIHGGSGENASNLPIEDEALVTVGLNFSIHRTSDFRCARSERVQGFFANEFPKFLERNYCRVFVLQDPDDQSKILGFYTLSPGLVEKAEVTTQLQKKTMPGLPIPMVRIGFMGRDDAVPATLGLGGVLLRDAALRVHRCGDLTAWGLYLDAETEQLATNFYQAKVSFKSTKSKPLVMYAPLKQLLTRPSTAPQLNH